jgi:thiol-disulfide isomerase/thioredoxin
MFATDVVEIKGLNEKNFNVAKRSGITLVEFWANWNVANKITMLDSITIEDAKIYRVLIDTNMTLAAEQKIVVVPTIIFYDEGKEFKRLQADLTFKMKVKKKDLQGVVDEILMSKF